MHKAMTKVTEYEKIEIKMGKNDRITGKHAKKWTQEQILTKKGLKGIQYETVDKL